MVAKRIVHAYQVTSNSSLQREIFAWRTVVPAPTVVWPVPCSLARPRSMIFGTLATESESMTLHVLRSRCTICTGVGCSAHPPTPPSVLRADRLDSMVSEHSPRLSCSYQSKPETLFLRTLTPKSVSRRGGFAMCGLRGVRDRVPQVRG